VPIARIEGAIGLIGTAGGKDSTFAGIEQCAHREAYSRALLHIHLGSLLERGNLSNLQASTGFFREKLLKICFFEAAPCEIRCALICCDAFLGGGL
jgi:hypothetical protein